MDTALDTVPYDILYMIISYLDYRDFVNLSRVSHRLNNLMENESIACRILKDTLLHSKEGQEANRTKSGYRVALEQLFNIAESFATAKPCSVTVLGYGRAFLYSGGFLSYIYKNEIRVLNVHGAGNVEQILDIDIVLSRTITHYESLVGELKVSLLNYSHDIVAFLVVGPRVNQLYAVDMRLQIDCWNDDDRLRLMVNLQSDGQIFVKHNRSYLYYGIYSDLQSQWRVECVDLSTKEHLTEAPVTLRKLSGCEMGQTVCFEIHESHLYGVSTSADEVPEDEVPQNSYYSWICLPPREDGFRKAVDRSVWRRQNCEGPIDDSWLDLSLRRDVATNRLTILECRREWLNGGSDGNRTYYMQQLPLPSEILQGTRQGFALTGSVSYRDISEASTLEALGDPDGEQPRKRLRRTYHTERQSDCESMTVRRSFIRAKTYLQTYHPLSCSFVDLVNDPCPDTEHSPRDRLRLRVVSRERRIFMHRAADERPQNHPCLTGFSHTYKQPMKHSEEAFHSQGVRMWPPDKAPQELNDLLCPTRRLGEVEALADERSVIYSVKHEGAGGYDNRAIVLINFDPSLRLPGLRRLTMTGQSTTAAPGTDEPHKGNSRQEHIVARDTAGERTGHAVSFVREEPATYLRVRHGYWLR
ncbi:hypothetical protein ABHI18_010867 [Aspergillus niger]